MPDNKPSSQPARGPRPQVRTVTHPGPITKGGVMSPPAPTAGIQIPKLPTTPTPPTNQP